MADIYSELWLSYSSIRDYLECPRSYFFKNVYRDSATGHKIRIVSPRLSLGYIIHSVFEELSYLKKEERFSRPILERLDALWPTIHGKKGGFTSQIQEEEYKKKAQSMLKNVIKNPGPLASFALKLKMDLPHFFLSEELGIVLCGKIDWIEYLPDTDTIHIIDFKTGKHEEDPKSLQISIYTLLATKCQKRPVSKTSYWFLERENGLVSIKLPDLKQTERELLKISKQILLSTKLGRFKCTKGDMGCKYCKPYEAIISGNAEYIGVDSSMRDLYLLFDNGFTTDDNRDSVIL